MKLAGEWVREYRHMSKQIAGSVVLFGLLAVCPCKGQTNAPTGPPSTAGYLTLPTLSPQVNRLSVNAPNVIGFGLSQDPRVQNPFLIVNTPLAPLPAIVSPIISSPLAANATAPQQGVAPGAAAHRSALPPIDAAGVVQMPVHSLRPVTVPQNALASVTLPVLAFGATNAGPAPVLYRYGLLDLLMPQYVPPAAKLGDWQYRLASSGGQATAPAAPTGGGYLSTFYLPSRIVPIVGDVASGGAAPPPAPVAPAPYFDALTTPFPGFNPLALIGAAVSPNLGPVFGPRF